MADDIDELLDEIESQFIGTKPKSITQKANKADSIQDDELQAALEDICTELQPPSKRNSAGTVSSHGLQKRCFPTIMAGTNHPMGLGSTTLPRACDALRCLKCDFKISWFNDFSWTSDVDYLFLRNNMPDFQKLRTRLKSKKGNRAYACQCQWRSVGEPIEVQSDSSLKWICSKH